MRCFSKRLHQRAMVGELRIELLLNRAVAETVGQREDQTGTKHVSGG